MNDLGQALAEKLVERGDGHHVPASILQPVSSAPAAKPKAAKKPVAKDKPASKRKPAAKKGATETAESSNVVAFPSTPSRPRCQLVRTRVIHDRGLIGSFEIRPGDTHLVTKSYAGDEPFLSTVVPIGEGYVIVRIFGGDLTKVNLKSPSVMKGPQRVVEECTNIGSRAIVEIRRGKGRVTEQLEFYNPMPEEDDPSRVFLLRLPRPGLIRAKAGIGITSTAINQEQEKAA